jgi:hypothetical protein
MPLTQPSLLIRQRCPLPRKRGEGTNASAELLMQRDHRTANGEPYGRPNGTPAVTVCTGLR